MRYDWRHDLVTLLAILFSIMILIGMSGCSPQYHMEKFLQKGGKVNVKETTITIHDTLKINGKDSIIEKTIQIECPEVETPKTRYITRFEYKRFNDSLKHVRQLYSDSLRNDLKTAKIDVKNNRIDSKEVIQLAKNQKRIETANNKTFNLALIVIGLICLVVISFRFSK